MGQLILLPVVCEPALVPAKRRKRAKATATASAKPATPAADNAPSGDFLDDLESLCDDCAHEKGSTSTPTSASGSSSTASMAVCQTAGEGFRMARRRAGSPTATTSSGSAMSSFEWWGTTSDDAPSGSDSSVRKRARQSVTIGRCVDLDSDGAG